MRNLFLALTGLAAALLLVPAFAEDKKDDKKEVKLDGTLVCTKCKLKETKECGHALLVKDGDKTTTYYIVDKGGKEEYHEKCCQADAPATYTGGKLSEKDSKKSLEGGKVEIKKEEKKGK